MSLGHPFMFNILPGTIMTYYFTTSPLFGIVILTKLNLLFKSFD